MAEFNKHPYHFAGLDEIVDEQGSKYIAIRKTQWIADGEEPDESKAKIEIRRWTVTDDKEFGKGFAFLTENGPHELTNVLVKKGFGDTKEILSSLRKRDDFKEVVEDLDKEEVSGEDGEYFDLRGILLDEEIEDDD